MTHRTRSRPARIALAVEYAALFFGLPLTFYSGWLPLHPFVALWLLAAVCAYVLLVSKSFDRRRWWNTDDLARRLLRASLPFLIAAPFLLAATALIEPDRLFASTYHRTRSALIANAQHALFGCYLFTIGLGWYFYYGSVGR